MRDNIDQNLGDDQFALNVLLSDISDEGLEWERRKARAHGMLDIVEQVLGEAYSREMGKCSNTLVLSRDVETDDLRVQRRYSCKRRWCPVCAWRRSLRQWAYLATRLPRLVEQHTPVRWLLLTLTVQNCSIEELPSTVSLMYKAFSKLTDRKTALGRAWPGVAWVRALEITFPRPNEAHPHIHVLLAVKPSYFGNKYVKQKEWVSRWQQALGVDYTPVVDVRCVKPLGADKIVGTHNKSLLEALGGVREVSKYVLKPEQRETPDALHALFSLKGRRFVDGGGWLKGVFSDRRKDGDDDGDDWMNKLEPLATYYWNDSEARYSSDDNLYQSKDYFL